MCVYIYIYKRYIECKCSLKSFSVGMEYNTDVYADEKVGESRVITKRNNVHLKTKG